MRLRSPQPPVASDDPQASHRPSPSESSKAGSPGRSVSSLDAPARLGRGAATPLSTTTERVAGPIPAASAGLFARSWDAPLEPMVPMPAARTESIVLRAFRRTGPRSAESGTLDATRVGIPVPPARAVKEACVPSDATVVCQHPFLRRPSAIVTTEAGTVIACNPLSVRVEPDREPVPEPAPKPKQTSALPLSADAHGATAVFLGRLGSDTSDDRAPMFVPDGESLEVGGKRGNPFARDPYIARYHAALVPTIEGVIVEDFGTANGVYVRVHDRAVLRDEDRLRIGQQLLRFHKVVQRDTTHDSVPRIGSPDPGAWGRLAIMLDPHREVAAYPLRRTVVELGQQTGDVQFPGDTSVGEPHCRLILTEEGEVLVEAERDAPATYVRVDRGDMVAYGSELLIGQTRLQIDR